MNLFKGFIYFFASFFISIGCVMPARILCLYPVPFHSHQKVFHVITEELAKRGHELVVLSSEAAKPMTNVTDITLHDKGFKVFETYYKNYVEGRDGFASDPITMWRDVFHKTSNTVVELFLEMPEVQAIINNTNEHFDVILTEACVSSQLVLAARFNVPVILVSSFFAGEPNFLRMGAPIHPILLPDYNALKINNLSIMEKLTSLYNSLMINYGTKKAEAEGDRLIRQYFGNDAPTSHELQKNVQLMLMNVHQIWDHNRPVPPSMVYMGALHLKKPKPIPEELQSYLESCIKGVIYVSLGSKVQFSDLSTETQRIFFSVLGSLPYDVLIKWNGGEIAHKPGNVRFEKWLPQNDMLHHPNMKLFIMQAGLQSTDEAIAAKVPLIGLPVFADQFYNAQQFEGFGIGKQLDINAISEDILREAIISVAEDKSYRVNIERLSQIMAEQRAGGLDKAIYWIEYTSKYGAGHLRSPLADASIVDYLMLDLLTIILCTIFTIVTLVFMTFKMLLQLSRTYKQLHNSKKTN